MPRGPDRTAAIAARDRLDQLVKPSGSLGALEALIERWAAITGAPPPSSVRAGVLICAADHGHTIHGTSLFAPEVSAQVTAAAARGDSAVGVLRERAGHDVLVADVGLAGPTPAGVRDAKVAPGTADMLAGPALTAAQVDAALSAGARLAAELADRGVDCLVVGEIGIGNTTTTAALASGAHRRAACGQRRPRHRAWTPPGSSASARRSAPRSSVMARGPSVRGALQAVGGLEIVALAGAILEAVRRRLPVVLDGYATTVAALAAARLEPAVGEGLIASHRSAEPGHALVLAELGLEPLLDLRLRLGEASGALLALPLVAAAGALCREMATFEEAGVTRS